MSSGEGVLGMFMLGFYFGLKIVVFKLYQIEDMS